MNSKVNILPTPLAEGWDSMNHYWLSLASEFEGDDSVEFLLENPKLGEKAKSRFRKAFMRIFAYPWLIFRSDRSEVYHILDHSYADLMRFLPKKAKRLVTVHDLIPLGLDSDLGLIQRFNFRRRVSHLRDADLLLCVSQATADEVKRCLGISCDKIWVVPMGVGSIFFDESGSLDSIPGVGQGRHPLLVVGSNLDRKNLRLVPRILALLDREKFVVVKVGAPFSQEVGDEIRALLGKEGLVEVGFVQPEDLPLYYQKSMALLFPSLMEGFGLPVLEAMAAGCPVVSSNRSSLPEVGGDAVAYFDPERPEDAARILSRLVCDEGYREKLSFLGRERAKTMTWQKHAERLREGYLTDGFDRKGQSS